MAGLCKEAKELKDMFLSFEIRHVKRVTKSYHCLSFAVPLFHLEAF